MQSEPLRGRSEPMARALTVLRGAGHRGSARVVLISGVAGIGKTALVSEICRQAGRMQFRVAAGKCDPIEQVWPGAPVIAALRSGREPLADAAQYEVITKSVDEPLLLGERIVAAMGRAAAAGPVLIALDDVQWADQVSRFLVRTLISRLAGSPVVWLLAGRDDDLGLGLVGGDNDRAHVEHIRLEPLTSLDLAAIAQDRLGRVPDEQTRRFFDAAGGNAFLAAQVLENLARSVARGRPDTLAAEFAATIIRQLAALDDTLRDLVVLVAVAGRPLPARDAAAMLPNMSAPELKRAVAEATESGLIVTCEDVLSFRHDLLREAVCAAIAPDQGREMHRACAAYYLAEAGEPLIAAAHARAAAAGGDLPGTEILIAVAERLAGVSADDAGELAALAFRTVHPDQPYWLETGRRSLAVLCETQWATEAVAVADLLLARVDVANQVGEIEAYAARALWQSGRLNELLTRTESVLRRDGLAPGVAARLRAARALAATRLVSGEVAARQAAVALEDARAVGDQEALALALYASGEAAGNEGRHRAALGYFRDLRSLTGSQCPAEEIRALQFLDRYGDAQALLDETRADSSAPEKPIPPALHCAQLWQDFNLGRMDEADAGARTLLELGRQLGSGVHAVDALIVRISVALLRGDPEAAEAQLRLADDLGNADDKVRRPGLTIMRGWLATYQGNHGAARDLLGQVATGAAGAYSYWPLWPCWMGMCFSVGMLAEDEEFASAVIQTAELAVTRNPGVPSFEGVALSVRGRSKGDLAMIARAAQVLARSPRPLLRGFGADCLGRALLAEGRRSDGLAHLDRAWDEYHRTDARVYRAEVQRMMSEAGARRDKWSAAVAEPRVGWASLTDAERRVATLIGAGRTNRAAAAELGVSVNTVGTHLRAAFVKLGVQSRVQLANVLHEAHLAARDR